MSSQDPLVPPAPGAAPQPASRPVSNPSATPPPDPETLGLIARLEREAKAAGAVPRAAVLWFEIGQLYEQVRVQRSAALAYQSAFKLDGKLVPNLRAARRLFAEVGKWDMALQLLDAEIAATPDLPARAALKVERGQILDDRLNRHDEALAAYEQAVAENPRDLGLLAVLEAAVITRHDDVKLLSVQQDLAEAIAAPALKVQYLLSASQLAEDPLKQEALAGQLLDKALAVAPHDPRVLAAVKRRAERLNLPELLLRVLAVEAESLGAAAAPVHLEVSRLFERLGKEADALSALRAARAASPDDPLVLAELSRVCEAYGKPEELAEVMSARVKTLVQTQDKVQLLLRLGALYEERLKKDQEAIQTYQTVLALHPDHPLALQQLGKLYHRQKAWALLLQTHEREAATQPEAQKLGALYRAAELCEAQLGREADAIARYQEVLALSPAFLPAQRALVRLFEKHKRWADLADLAEREIDGLQDRDQLLTTIHQVARLAEDHLDDVPRAIKLLQKGHAAAPQHLPTLRALARLYERAGEWAAWLAVSEQELALTPEPRGKVGLLHRIAEVLDDKLSQGDQAIPRYQEVLALSPAYVPALKALSRLYAQRQRWSELAQMYKQEADLASSPEQAASLTFRMAELFEEKLADPNNAVALHQEVLTLDPNHLGAMRALSRLHRAGRAWEPLVQVLHHQASVAKDPVERANVLFEVAAIWEDAGRLEPAVEGYLEVLAVAPQHTISRRALERIYLSMGAIQQLVRLREAEAAAGTPEARADALCALAVLEPATAAARYEAALALSPQSLPALKGLERLRGAERAARPALRSGLAQAGAAEPALAAQWLVSAAQDLDKQGQGELALGLWKRAHAALPTAPRPAQGLEAALIRAGDTRGLADLFAEQLEREAGAAKVTMAMKLGRLCEPFAPQRALAAYASVLAVDARSVTALRASRRVHLGLGDVKSAVATLDAEASVAAEKADSVACFTEGGMLLLEKLNDAEGAQARFQKALELDPLAPQATEQLQLLLARRGGPALVQLQLRRADAKLAASPGEAAALYVEAARSLAGELQSPNEALAALDKALVANPKAADALQLKAELLLKAQRHPEAARTLAQRIELGGDPRTLAAFQYRLGILLQDTLSDANAALPYLQAALPQLPDPLDALERVGRILLSQRQLTQAAEVYRRLVERSPERSRRAAHALTLGRLTDEAGDAPAAVALYKQVLELQPGEPEAISRLTALHEKLGQASELAAMLEAQSPRGAPQAQVVSLRLRAAGLYLKQNEPQKAASALRFALESDPNAIEAHSQLADLLIKESSQAASAIESYRQVIRLDPLRPEPYHALFKLYDAIKQVDRQFCAASVLVFLRQANAMEKLFVDDTKGRIPQDTAEKLAEGDLDALLLHPLARGVVGETLRKMGDQLTRLYPGDLDGQGLGRADKLKPDHAQAKPLRSILTSIGVDKLEIYQGKRGQGVTLENTDPPSAVIGPDLVRKFQTREQRFVMARAGLYLRQKAIVAQKLSAPDLQAVLAAAVKVVSPDFARLGPVDPELLKQVKKGLSNQALRDLKVLLPELDRAPKLDVTQLQSGLSLSADRTGLVYSGDIAASLALRAREATAFIASKLDTPESVRAAVVGRAEMLQLLTFSVSDDFFRLRQKLRMGLGGTAP